MPRNRYVVADELKNDEFGSLANLFYYSLLPLFRIVVLRHREVVQH